MTQCRCLLAGMFLLTSSAAVLSAGSDSIPSDAEVLSHPLHFDVNLVQVDAVVTDGHGQRVSGLRAEDFEVFQDGKRQQITHFLYVPGEAKRPEPLQRQITRSEARRVFLIYIDDRVMNFAAFTDMRKALGKFIDQEFQPGDLVAFYRISGGPGAWRSFSSDPREVRAALDHMTWLRAPRNVAWESVYAHALRALADLPGRKAIVFVHSGITMEPDVPFDRIGPQRRPPAGTTGLALLPTARDLADAANRVSAAIYSVDVRGLAVMGPESATDSEVGVGGNVPRNGAELARETLNRQLSYSISQDVPAIMSDLTGGLTFHDTNDLLGALHKIGDDERGYYLLGWDPGNKAFEPKGREILYHSLRIRVDKPGLKVRTRAGYFGVPEGQPTHISTRSRMMNAIYSPFREEDIAVDLTASVQESATMGPHIECLAHVGPMGLEWTTDSRGCRTARLDVAVVRLRLGEDADPNGVHGQLATIEACGKSANAALRDGFVFTSRLNTPPGPYEMRVLVRTLAPGEGAVLGPKRLITDSDPTAPHIPAHIGSASEFVTAPDLRKSFALSGITLGLDGAPAPVAIGYTSWHVAVPGDPGIRDFHPGDVISYRAALLGGNDRSLPFGADLKVLFEGKEIHTQMIQAEGNTLQGVYHIDEKAPAGQYLLGVTIPGKRSKEKGTNEEWINFQVVKD